MMYPEIAGLHRYPLARRGFVMTSLISGFTLATQRVEAQAIQTDTGGHRCRGDPDPGQGRQVARLLCPPGQGTNFPSSW